NPPAPSAGPPSPGPRVNTGAPSGVGAQARADGSVLVWWTPGTPDARAYRVLRTGDGAAVASAGAGARSEVVTLVSAGETVAFVVEATVGGGRFRSAPSNAVTVFGRPGAPANLKVAEAGRTATSLTVRIGWDLPPANGAPISAYDLSVTGPFGGSPIRLTGQPIAGRPRTLSLQCGGACVGALDVGV